MFDLPQMAPQTAQQGGGKKCCSSPVDTERHDSVGQWALDTITLAA